MKGLVGEIHCSRQHSHSGRHVYLLHCFCHLLLLSSKIFTRKPSNMSSGIVILRALKNLAISNTLKYPTTRVILGANQCSVRLYCAEHRSEKTSEPDPRDRSVKIPVETSIRYLKSKAYRTTYGDDPVWVPYRRNGSSRVPPLKTRRTCIVEDRVITGNPCPVCRDEYLVLHEKNVELLKQFISPFNGEVLPAWKTKICRRQFDNLMVAVIRAKTQGLLPFDVPFRRYDYSHYAPRPEPKMGQHEQ